MTEISYQILAELDSYGEELSPRYLSAIRKKDFKEFDLNIENVKQLLENSANCEGGTVFNDLGRHISFFPSYNEELSCSISIKIGNTSPLFNNTVVIDLPYGHFSGFDSRHEVFENLFKRLITLFDPFFAFVSNNRQLRDNGYWEKSKPTYVHWINYYDESTAETIGVKRLVKLDKCDSFNKGYILKLQDVPIDIHNSKHLEAQQLAGKQLGLL